ncbi:MAG: glycosyltransferase family 4 protein [Acidimicrobiaceae bacterium]|nr:glycosyltransferase family 4 protein [Acidimicrobiaceae bacterium]MYB86857.1 glycosyltransferase family 4 protein [Acidimicrobiaceae bacterium]MYH94768.1 glycosyltransferase family 4 protein [Acidimicrobiaceae bacterium]
MPAPADNHAPLRVALLSYRGKPHVGGQGVYVSRLSTALTDLGHHVVVLGGPPYPELDERVPLVQLGGLDIWAPPHPMRKPRAWELKDWIDIAEHVSFVTGNFSEPMAFSLRAWRHLRTRRAHFDVVHDNQTLGWGILALQRQGWPLLETIHHPITVDRRLELAHAHTLREQIGKRRWYAFTKMQTQVARRLPRVLTVSESSKRDIANDHGVPPERIHVVPVGVDPELFAPLPEISRVPGRLITTASADVTMKGLSFLLEAVAKLRTERHIELTIIGKAKTDSAASRAISELGLADAVTFVSGVSDRRIVELYAEAELAVVPSLYEGFSLPAIEAMSCGVPLVATTGGALPEVAGKHGETCFLTEPGDAEALAAVLQDALDSPEARDRVGRAGRERVVSQWSWRHTAERTVEQYRAVIEASG